MVDGILLLTLSLLNINWLLKETAVPHSIRRLGVNQKHYLGMLFRILHFAFVSIYCEFIGWCILLKLLQYNSMKFVSIYENWK